MIPFQKHALALSAIGLLLVAAGCSTSLPEKKSDAPVTQQVQTEVQKVYVALEADSAVAVIDTSSMTLSKKISLDSESGDEFMAHNVQVAPNGKSVWVTVNAMKKDMHGFLLTPTAYASEDDDGSSKLESQLIVINPDTDTIQKRISLGTGLDLAHVVLTPDSNTVITASQKKGTIFVINATTGEIIKKIALDVGNQPHGIRVLPDGSKAYVALMKGKGMVEIDLQTYHFSVIPMTGSTVQVAITPDGKKILASSYDTKKIMIYAPETKEVKEINLPSDSKGPLQLYPTPDSKYVYVADQGYYSKQPEGEKVYKIDLETLTVVKEIVVGKAPHGVVVSPDGKYVFVTNLMDKSVSVIDIATDTVSSTIRVGKEPNGISIWSSKTGGTP